MNCGAVEQALEADERPKVARTEARSPGGVARRFVLAASSRGRPQLKRGVRLTSGDRRDRSRQVAAGCAEGEERADEEIE